MASSGNPVIALTTDFGRAWSYVAQIEASILAVAPAARVVHVTHEVPPQSVATAEVVLRGVAFGFPPGTCHVAVVDPGVGTDRRAVAVQARGCFFVGPDNGVLAQVCKVEGARAVALDRPWLYRGVAAPTFHGRDIFAPVAAHLVMGLPIEECGSSVRIESMAPSTLPEVVRDGQRVVGQVVAADSFGTLMTNLAAADVPEGARMSVDARPLRRVRTYAEGASGELVALIGSDGHWELAVVNGSAAVALGWSWQQGEGAKELQVVCDAS